MHLVAECTTLVALVIASASGFDLVILYTADIKGVNVPSDKYGK